MARLISTDGKFLNKQDLLIRHVLIMLLAFGITSLKVFNDEMEWFSPAWNQQFGFILLMVATIWNGNVLLVDIADTYIPWHKSIRNKLLVHLVIAMLWPVSAHFGFNIFVHPIIMGEACKLTSSENIGFLVTTVVITLLVNSIFTSIEFFRFWRQSVKEKETLKRESITAEFETLKSQINPHFLFNSLNTLTSLIEENPQQATEFVQKLANVYRYVLTQKDKQLVNVSEEIEFIQSYIYLNKIRFGENLITQIDIPVEYRNLQIVTLALQMLIENCIKHNIVSGHHPLTVKLYVEDNQLIVANNLQRKQRQTDSNGIGLMNIVHRYSFITDKMVDITDDGKQFKVALPLIAQSQI